MAELSVNVIRSKLTSAFFYQRRFIRMGPRDLLMLLHHVLHFCDVPRRPAIGFCYLVDTFGQLYGSLPSLVFMMRETYFSFPLIRNRCMYSLIRR